MAIRIIGNFIIDDQTGESRQMTRQDRLQLKKQQRNQALARQIGNTFTATASRNQQSRASTFAALQRALSGGDTDQDFDLGFEKFAKFEKFLFNNPELDALFGRTKPHRRKRRRTRQEADLKVGLFAGDRVIAKMRGRNVINVQVRGTNPIGADRLPGKPGNPRGTNPVGKDRLRNKPGT